MQTQTVQADLADLLESDALPDDDACGMSPEGRR